MFHFISGVHYVFDTNFARNFSLVESCNEFIHRFYDSETNLKALPMLASACPGQQVLAFLFLCSSNEVEFKSINCSDFV